MSLNVHHECDSVIHQFTLKQLKHLKTLKMNKHEFHINDAALFTFLITASLPALSVSAGIWTEIMRRVIKS